jgi:hypothetical protein
MLVSSSSSAICLYAVVVAGRFLVSFEVDRDASIATLLEALEWRLFELGVPHECKAYTSKRDGVWLDDWMPDAYAIIDGNEKVATKFYTDAARLDPTKTVADYFRDAPVENVFHIVVQWSASASAMARDNAIFARKRAYQLTRWKNQAALRVREQQLEAARQNAARSQVKRRVKQHKRDAEVSAAVSSDESWRATAFSRKTIKCD